MDKQFKKIRSEIDCSRFRYRPDKREDLERLQKEHEDFNPNLSPYMDKRRLHILQYIILFYSTNTPLDVKIHDFVRRKIYAAQLAGFESNNLGRFHKDVQAMLECRDKITNKMILRYTLLTNATTALLYKRYNEIFIALAAVTYNKEKINKNNVDLLDKLHSKIKETEEELLRHERAPEIVEQVADTVDLINLEIRPEIIARKKKSGEDPIFDPDEEEGSIRNI